MLDWWEGTGLALFVTAPKDKPWEDIPTPDPNVDLRTKWLDPDYWAQNQLAQVARTFWGGAAFPIFHTIIGGPGSLGLFLGCEGVLAKDTVWYEPNVADPETHPPLRFDPENIWWKRHLTVIESGLRLANGRFLVGYPDLIENIDTLAQLRGAEQTLTDLLERPAWVKRRIAEINRAFFDSFDALWNLLRDPWGGNAFVFGLWGPGKTAKVQCDFSCMIGPAMFREFVVPALVEQCDWLDFAMYHLDGTQALPQLDNLLEIESLHAIEWTPQSGLPGGGARQWHDLYRRIKAGGKGVQAIGVRPEEVEPLIEAVGAEGLYIHCRCETETQARELLRRCGWKGKT